MYAFCQTSQNVPPTKLATSADDARTRVFGSRMYRNRNASHVIKNDVSRRRFLTTKPMLSGRIGTMPFSDASTPLAARINSGTSTITLI